MSDEIQIRHYRSSLHPQWWRHPIAWWRLRPFRRVLRRHRKEREAMDPQVRQALEQHERDMERAFLFGEGDRS